MAAVLWESLMSALSIVGVAGNITRPSRTATLLSAVLAEIVTLSGGAQSRLIELVDIGPELFQSIQPERFESFVSQRISPQVRSIIRAIEAADALVVGTPVYKGSYTGALKHLFDLIPPNALAGKPVLLAATGGSPLHGLVTEHELRPLFGFFGALTMPTTIFALESDFQNYRIEKPELAARISRAAAEIAEFLMAQSARWRAQAAIATA
jgi:FMN reductase